MTKSHALLSAFGAPMGGMAAQHVVTALAAGLAAATNTTVNTKKATMADVVAMARPALLRPHLLDGARRDRSSQIPHHREEKSVFGG